MAYKCVIWGIGVLYDAYINNIFFELLKGNIEVIGVVSNDTVIHSIDGFSFIKKKNLKEVFFDYIIVACDFEIVKREALEFGISRERLIKVEIFRLPGFDFKEYIQLKKSNVSIISNHCWGGFVSHTLGLPFNSPFVNLYMDEREYIKLLMNFSYYMNQQLVMYKDSDSFGEPVGVLDDVKIYFLHYESFKKAEESWNKRKKRINFENLFVEMTIRENPDLVETFTKLPFINKKCFIHFDVGKNNTCVEMSEFSDITVRKKYNHRFKEYVHNTAEINCKVSRPYNPIKLLNGDQNFMRKKFKTSEEILDGRE